MRTLNACRAGVDIIVVVVPIWLSGPHSFIKNSGVNISIFWLKHIIIVEINSIFEIIITVFKGQVYMPLLIKQRRYHKRGIHHWI